MKKLYLLIALLIAFSSKSEAQYHFTSHYWYHDTSGDYFNEADILELYGVVPPDTAIFACNNPVLYVTTNVYDSSLSVKTYFGDGTYSTFPILDSGSFGYSFCNLIYNHLYFMPGVYTIKQVLYYGSIPMDSIIGSLDHYTCNSTSNVSYYDSSGAGHFVSGVDIPINTPLNYIIDSDGITLDTVECLGSYYYSWLGDNANVYGFKPIPPSTLYATTPPGGIVYDTISTGYDEYFTNYFGFRCSGMAGFDLSVNANAIAGRHHSSIVITIDNVNCTSQDATITMHFSPKYNFTTAAPLPSSVSGNTLVWSLTGVSIFNPQIINVTLDILPWLLVGDTVHNDYLVTPMTGDLDTNNNYIQIVNTVTGSWDPNEMQVLPSGIITAGTKLQYTIGFENTGNDTAFNISVYDTLSDNVDVNSLNIVTASAVMNIASINHDGHNIIKFNFPNINLLDSSHHNLCDGMVQFTVNSKSGLANGTTIFNHAGIVFDDNPVVMTDTVEDIIGIPASVAIAPNRANVSVYPNPVNDQLHINGDVASYKILNIVGTAVEQGRLATGDNSISTASFVPGVYLLEVTTNEGQRTTAKIIKQ